MTKIWIAMCLIYFFKNNFVKPEERINQNYSFKIDYETNQFLLDGKPFRYVSGSFHYFRAATQYWRPILRKMRAAGLSAVDVYVEWSLHESENNKWNWNGNSDVINFIEIAKEEDLLVILRPGPYICAERDLGGFPYWLLKLVPNIKLRSNDNSYLFYVERYLNQILMRIKPFLRGNAGPIIMVQIENEYGSYITCNAEYKKKLYNIFNQHIGTNAVLFTTDKANDNSLKCGSIPGVYSTIDFGSTGDVEQNYKTWRKFVPKGPLVNSEYYTGWFSYWNEPFRRINIKNVVNTFDYLLSYNVSVNFYMFYGGSNFGFTSGANIRGSYKPQLTSYDYDAPLNEAGDPTPKYFELRNIISKYFTLPKINIPAITPKGNYGVVTMVPTLDLFTIEARSIFGTPEQEFFEPPTFETLGVSHWLILYEAKLSQNINLNHSLLNAKVKDRAIIYVNNYLSCILSRMNDSYVCPLIIKEDSYLQLLVENMGRVTSGYVDFEDFKGISEVTLDNVPITPWKVTGFHLSSVTAESLITNNTNAEIGKLYSSPQFLVGTFYIENEPLDTFLSTEGWGKGVAYINGNNLGRYWPSVGPQITLYIPAPFLKKGDNSIVLLELENVNERRSIKFQITPVLDDLKPTQ